MIFTDRHTLIADALQEKHRASIFYIDPDSGQYGTQFLDSGLSLSMEAVTWVRGDVWNWEKWEMYMPEDLLEWLPEQ